MMTDRMPGRKGEFGWANKDMRHLQVRQIKHDEKKIWQKEAADGCREGKLDGCVWPDCECYDLDEDII